MNKIKEILSTEEKQKHWDGAANKAIRYYFYVQRGLGLINEFRYLIMAIMATYALLGLKDPIVMVMMFLVAIPVLIILGWIYTHKMATVMEWLGIKYSTHYAKLNIEYQERQTNALEKLVERNS